MSLQYRVKRAPGDVAAYVLLPGDPGRVPVVASFWDETREVARNREYVTFTGTYRGAPISCSSTGIGAPSTAIALEELVLHRHLELEEHVLGLQAALGPQDILEYQQRFDDMHAALYRRDVWAAAYLIGGGCSDDGFIDFRAGIIAQGREWYEKVAMSPDSLAGHPAVASAAPGSWCGALFCELVNYAAASAYEGVTGTETGFSCQVPVYPSSPRSSLTCRTSSRYVSAMYRARSGSPGRRTASA